MSSEQSIQFYLSRTHRVSGPLSDTTCPICLENYEYPNYHGETNNDLPDPLIDYPVTVNGLRYDSECRHVFGRRCIEGHFRSGGPWSRKCPTCREEWFPETDDMDILQPARPFVRVRLPTLHVPPYITPGAVAGSDIRREPLPQGHQASPERPALQGIGTQRSFPEASAAQPSSPARVLHRHVLNLAIANLQRMLWTEEIDEEDEESSIRVHDVERAVNLLYGRLRSLAQAREGVGSVQGNEHTENQNRSRLGDGPLPSQIDIAIALLNRDRQAARLRGEPWRSSENAQPAQVARDWGNEGAIEWNNPSTATLGTTRILYS